MFDDLTTELSTIDLGDERLNRRSRTLLQSLAADPEVSINAACQGWAETQAAYQFFDQERTSAESILAPHRQTTLERMAAHPLVLIVQDTTELDYSDHPPEDVGCLNTKKRRGLYDQTHLAVTPDHLCLGVVGCEWFDRTPESLGKAKERKTWPIEEKESFRWLKGYRLASELQQELPQTQLVSVADSEADIDEILTEARDCPEGADDVIRAKEDRCTLESDPAAGKRAYRKVRTEVAESKVLDRRVLELRRTPKREARSAVVEIRALEVTVKPPHARSHLGSLCHRVVLVTEVDGPEDGTDVDWLLMTSLPIDSLEQVDFVLECYRARWTIEEYFRVFKTGCCVEKIQLETVDRVTCCLAFSKIIAWRLLFLTYLNRTAPSLPCESVFSGSEWRSVWKVVQKGPLPEAVPTLEEIMNLVSHLGGYNHRKNEAPPGAQTFWRGLRKMQEYATAWEAFQKE